MESQILNRNTIVLDWGKLSRCLYRHATEYIVPEVGYHLFHMINDVLKMDLRSINCVGHSLGNFVHSNSFILYSIDTELLVNTAITAKLYIKQYF